MLFRRSGYPAWLHTSAAAGGGGGVGQIKPDGLPSINLSDPFAASLLYYGLDLGTGTIVDLMGNITMTGHSVPSVASSANGKGIHWPAVEGGTTGYTGDVYSFTAIRTATNLANQGTGAGYTFACTYMQLGTSSNGNLIFGRPAHALESAPFVNWTFNGEPSTNRVWASINNNGTLAQVGDFFDIGALNVFTTLVCTVVNTSSGVATAKFYVDGSLVGSPATGLVVTDSALAGFGADSETHIGFGSAYHNDTGFSFNAANALVYEGIFAARAWSSSEVTAFHAAPYSLLTW